MNRLYTSITRSALFTLIVITLSCGKTPPDDTDYTPSGSSVDTPGNSTSVGCGVHNGKTLHKGPSGGCYYINSSGKKTYVNRNECKC